MKKFMILLFSFALIFAVSACGSDEDDSGDSTGDTGSGDTGSGDSGSGDTGSGDTGSGDTGSADTGSGDTGSGDTGGDTAPGDTGSTGSTEACGCGAEDGDADGDGIPNGIETCDDNDNDGLPNCLDTDSDGDGFSDTAECPSQPCVDTDGDGLPDFLDRDSDNDGLTDKEEKEHNTDPLRSDSDGDGSDDLAEIVYGSDPLSDSSSIPSHLFYVVLPYQANWKAHRTWEFDTDISKVDIAFLLDLSGSMDAEQANLKEKIKTDVVQKVQSLHEGTLDAAYAFVHFMDFDSDMDKVYKVDTLMTTNVDELQAAIDSTPTPYGGTEVHTLVLYAATASEDIIGKAKPAEVGGAFSQVNLNIPLPDCTGRVGNRSGLCYREKAMPILIMITDENYTDVYMPPDQTITASQLAIQSLVEQNAKFIGIDTSSASGNNNITKFFKNVSDITGTLDANGNNFNFAVNNDAVAADGTPMSEKIGEAIESLTSFVQMDVWVAGNSNQVCAGTDINVAQFIEGGIPVKAEPPEGAVIDEAGKKFRDVNPGTVVTFDVQFHNDFCPNATDAPVLYVAEAMVLGEGAYLSKKEVNVIVPRTNAK